MVSFPQVVFDCSFCQQVNVQLVVGIYQSQCLYILQDNLQFFFLLVMEMSYDRWCMYSHVV